MEKGENPRTKNKIREKRKWRERVVLTLLSFFFPCCSEHCCALGGVPPQG
jgi:hypothetical protein